MIFPAKLGALSTTGAPDTAIPAAQPAATPFDTILSLESLAATCAALDPLFMGVGAEGACGAELSPTELDDADDTDDTEDEDPLAFLAGLLNAAAVTPQAPSHSGEGLAATDEAVGDALSGPARQATTSAESPFSLAQPAGADGTSGLVAGTNSDVSSAQKLLAAIDPNQAAKTDVDGVRSDAASPDAATTGLARAAELLAHGPRHAAAAARDFIATPARDPHWAQDFGARVSLMVRGGESSASLQLSPSDLGPVDVNVMVRDSQATIHFGAAQAETRALLEASIPRLREMLAAQGFHLMDASVSQGFARQARSETTVPTRFDGEPEVEVRAITRIGPTGLLDTYA